MTDLIATASAYESESSEVVARTHLPNFRDLQGSYEIAVLYASFIKNWDETSGYTISHIDKDGVLQHINLSPQPYAVNSLALDTLASQLQAEFGTNMRSAPVKIVSNKTKSGVVYVLRLQQRSEAELTPKLAKLLGLDIRLENKDSKSKDFKIEYTRLEPPLESSIYLITCDQIKPNFINPAGSLTKVLETVHVPFEKNSNIVQHNSPYPIYHPVDEFLHNSLKFRLLKESGEPVLTDNCHFYLKYHIRSRHVETSQ